MTPAKDVSVATNITKFAKNPSKCCLHISVYYLLYTAFRYPFELNQMKLTGEDLAYSGAVATLNQNKPHKSA